MCRQLRGMPRSPISQVTWCADSGDRVQKSHCMSWSRRLLSWRRFWDRMKCWNFIGSLMKKTGVMFGRYRTVAFDGCQSVKVADTPRNRGWLGKPAAPGSQEAAYPGIWLMTLAETGTR